jgi:neutral ceramidase
MRRCLPLASVLVVAALALPGAASAATRTATLRAGAGTADITPPQTGYFLGGWTLAYRTAQGQSTRLLANTLVLQRGGQKVALVAASLFAVTEGMRDDIIAKVADLGFTRENVLLEATHTHSGPGGWTNNPVYNTAAPDIAPSFLLSDPQAYVNFFVGSPVDKQLYTFLVDRIALSIRRANADLAPAAAAWGHTTLVGLTQNRSLEAHLANFGVDDPTYGSGKVSQDPGGYPDTIDPNVDVLRVDKLRRHRVRCGPRRHRRTCVRTVDIPIGAWSNFAAHGTVVHSITEVYSGDHLGDEWRYFEQAVRTAGRVPAKQTVVDVYPNADEGDQTAGLQHLGLSGADEVGFAEAAKMFAAWKSAKRGLTRTPKLDLRWTMSCFCGRDTATGPVDTAGHAGLPFLTGAPEGRGPLYDRLGLNLSGTRSPISTATQGDKVIVPIGSFPPAVPLTVVRIGDGAIASVPGEATVEVGKAIRNAVLSALSPVGVSHIVIGGLADDYIQYVTTPAEYAWQSYEGGSTLYGPNEASFLRERLVELARALASGQPAPKPFAVDSSYGVHATGPAYPAGSSSGMLTQQPAASYARLGHAEIAWAGGPLGHDRPLDTPFVSAQRRVHGKWQTVDTDLGIDMVWRVDKSGHYTAAWEIPLSAPVGTYQLVVTATRYTLTSASFSVTPFTGLKVAPAAAAADRAAVTLSYPHADPVADFTARPASVPGGSVTFTIAGRPITATSATGSTYAVKAAAGASVTVAAGAARDHWGNTNAAALTVR